MTAQSAPFTNTDSGSKNRVPRRVMTAWPAVGQPNVALPRWPEQPKTPVTIGGTVGKLRLSLPGMCTPAMTMVNRRLRPCKRNNEWMSH
jgi:hypothetical protein